MMGNLGRFSHPTTSLTSTALTLDTKSSRVAEYHPRRSHRSHADANGMSPTQRMRSHSGTIPLARFCPVQNDVSVCLSPVSDGSDPSGICSTSFWTFSPILTGSEMSGSKETYGGMSTRLPTIRRFTGYSSESPQSMANKITVSSCQFSHSSSVATFSRGTDSDTGVS